MLTLLVFGLYGLFCLAVIAGLDKLCEVKGWKGTIPGPESIEREGSE